jgi:hypothetical protein
MSETTVVDARLDKLEQDNRRLKLTVGALLLVMAAVPLVGAVMPEQIPEVIRARAFHAIDGNGMSRTVMGEIGFAYFDVNRTIRAMMDGGSIRVLDENGTLRAMMDAGSIRVSDENGTLRTLMDGKTIAYLDENRVTRAQLYADGFFFSDENGNVVWRTPER